MKRKRNQVLIDELKALPSITVDNVSWEFAYEYPGIFVFRSDLGSFYCTPFYEGADGIAVNVVDINYYEVALDDVYYDIPYPDACTGEKFVAAIMPALTAATSKLTNDK